MEQYSLGLLIYRLATLALGLLLLVVPARADFLAAQSAYNSQTVDDQVSTTFGLVATGDFNGFHGYGFTERYYKAILAFETRENLNVDGVLQPWELVRLKDEASKFFARYELQSRLHAVTGSKLYVPRNLFDKEFAYEKGVMFQRNDHELSLSFAAHSRFDTSFSDLFELLRQPVSDRSVSYSRLRPSFFVITGENKGRKFYTYMEQVPYGASGFTLSWGLKFEGAAGRLTTLMANSFLAIPSQQTPSAPSIEIEAPPSASSVAQEPPKQEEPKSGAGTGFKITSEGHILTNFHVAGKCKSISVRRPGTVPVAARVIAGDERNDLALLKADQPIEGPVAEFHDGAPVKAGAEIVIYGFPLTQLLSSSGNVVTGNVTSLAGIGDNSSLYQVSAPVQPGNSGGPVLDREGRVVGVVVSKLDSLFALKELADIPQNVNFAIKASVAQNFLDGANVAYIRQSNGAELKTTALAEKAQGFTYLVGCRN